LPRPGQCVPREQRLLAFSAPVSAWGFASVTGHGAPGTLAGPTSFRGKNLQTSSASRSSSSCEARYYYLQNKRLVPYAALAFGGALYGNEWGSDTGGILAFLGIGVEYQVSRTSVVGAALGYRPIVFRRFQDRAGQVRSDELFGFGFTHMVGLELVFEVRDPLPRW
jgi:hypothetical protein